MLALSVIMNCCQEDRALSDSTSSTYVTHGTTTHLSMSLTL